jgi:hypothetical protein
MHLAALSTYLLHPLVGRGYQFWSGIGSDLGEVAIIGGVLAVVRRHNCHVKGCPKLIWRRTAAGDSVCRHHHPEGQKSYVQILEDHDAAKGKP